MHRHHLVPTLLLIFAVLSPANAFADHYVLLSSNETFSPTKSSILSGADLPLARELRSKGLELTLLLRGPARERVLKRLAKAPSSASDASLERLLRWARVRDASGSRDSDEIWLSLSQHADVQHAEEAPLSWISAVPDDSLFINQAPFLGQLTLIPAWDVVKGEDGAVVIAIVDGGTEWRHPDLIDNIWRNPGEIEGNGVDDDGNGFVDDVRGWNFANGSDDPTGLPNLNFNASHGTHVAGLAAARTNNRRGVVGSSWNARILPVNASDPQVDRGIAFGYEGILYAAMLGADVINASWARPGGGTSTPQRASVFEEDIVNAARALGSLVVVAAGNNGLSDFPAYPAFYPSTLAVTATDFSGPQLWFSANRDHWVDIAAPGVRLMSTVAGGGYAIQSGTSMASPVVAGIAALVKTQHPDWSPEQIRQQLRWSGLDINLINPTAAGLMGGGLVQAGAAVGPTLPGVHVASVSFNDQDGDGLAEGGEVLEFSFDLVNEGAAAQNVFVRLLSDDPSLQILDGKDTVRIPVLQAETRTTVRDGFLVWLSLQVPPGHRPALRLEVEVEGRRLANVFYPQLAPLDASVANAGVEYSLTANGKLGFSTLTSPYSLGGVGLRRPGQRSVMLGGGLLVGDGPDRVSDAVQSARPLDAFEDFHPLQGQGLTRSEGPDAVELRASFSDRVSASRLGVGVHQRALASPTLGREDFVLFSTEVEAQIDSLFGVRVAFLVDWEMTYLGEDRDRILVDPAERMVLAQSVSADPALSAWAGFAVIEAPAGFASGWLWDIRTTDTGVDPALYDPADLSAKPSDETLWQLMSGPADGGISPEGGVASVLSVGPFDLARGEHEVVTMAWLLGDSEEDCRAALLEAKIAWTELRDPSGGGAASLVEFLPTIPNPIRGRGLIRFRLPTPSSVRLRILDQRGREVVQLLSGPLSAGVHRATWSGVDSRGASVARGVYRLHLQTNLGDRTQAVVWLGR
jgi:serine protease